MMLTEKLWSKLSLFFECDGSLVGSFPDKPRRKVNPRHAKKDYKKENMKHEQQQENMTHKY